MTFLARFTLFPSVALGELVSRTMIRIQAIMKREEVELSFDYDLGFDVEKPESDDSETQNLPKSLTPPSRIIIPILTTGSTMKINHNLDPVVSGPTNNSIEVLSLTLDIWFST